MKGCLVLLAFWGLAAVLILLGFGEGGATLGAVLVFSLIGGAYLLTKSLFNIAAEVARKPTAVDPPAERYERWLSTAKGTASVLQYEREHPTAAARVALGVAVSTDSIEVADRSLQRVQGSIDPVPMLCDSLLESSDSRKVAAARAIKLWLNLSDSSLPSNAPLLECIQSAFGHDNEADYWLLLAAGRFEDSPTVDQIVQQALLSPSDNTRSLGLRMQALQDDQETAKTLEWLTGHGASEDVLECLERRISDALEDGEETPGCVPSPATYEPTPTDTSEQLPICPPECLERLATHGFGITQDEIEAANRPAPT